jgi:hypothetical protein
MPQFPIVCSPQSRLCYVTSPSCVPAVSCTSPYSLLPLVLAMIASPVPAVYCHQSQLCTVTSRRCALPQSRLYTATSPGPRLCTASSHEGALSPVPSVHCIQSRLCTATRLGYVLQTLQAVSCHQSWLCTATISGYVQPPVLAATGVSCVRHQFWLCILTSPECVLPLVYCSVCVTNIRFPLSPVTVAYCRSVCCVCRRH